MSIATEISRIQTATSDIKTAITGKGVAVPEGSKIDALPALINSITSGGGNEEIKRVNIAVGSSNYASFNVSGYVPDYSKIKFMIWQGGSSQPSSSSVYFYTPVISETRFSCVWTGNLRINNAVLTGITTNGDIKTNVSYVVTNNTTISVWYVE